MRIRTLVLPLFFLISLMSVPGHATHWDIVSRYCPGGTIDIPDVNDRNRVPVGCEVIDCCPGCPGPGDLTWRINVDKTLTKAVTLRFEGVDAKSLKLGGNARFENGVIVAGPGESTISGLREPKQGPGPVAVVQPQFDRGMMEKAANGDADHDGGVQITQFLGDYVVNTFRSRYTVSFCPPPPAPPQDKIRLTSNTSNDNAVILADFRTSGGCQNDNILRTSTEVGIGNALTNGACNSEVSVFSDDNAMSFQPGVTTWTDPAGDLHTVALQPILNVPLQIWIANGGAGANPANDSANANLLYNQNNVGVQFTPTFNNVSGNAAAVALIGTLSDCSTAAAIQGSAFFIANRVNVYYVNGAFTGVNCGLNRNINYIGTIANIASLPHEIGHAYSLRPSDQGGHVNALPGFGNDNIMFAGGPAARNRFTVGQAFRLDTDVISALNTNGNRVGPTRRCPPLTTDGLCPALILDTPIH